MNFYDILFAKKLNSGGGSPIDLQTLTVTENGTTDAPSGVAYNKVITDVPLPANAYLKKSVTGLPQPIASFSDGASAPLNSLTASIEPVQSGSGDPSPNNVRPISGWTEEVIGVRGVNVWDEAWEVGYIDGETGQPTAEPTSIRSENFNKCVPNTNYYGKFNGTVGQALYLYWYDSDKNFIARTGVNNTVSTSPSKASYFKIACYHYGTTYNNDISINYPSTDTEYHAYAGTTYTIDLDGTRYGGTLDVTSGVLTVDRVYKQIKDFEWQTQGGYYGRFYATPSGADKALYDANKTLIISDTYKGYSDTDKPTITNGVYIGSGGSIKVWDSEYTEATDIDAWETARANVELCYYLATPLTIQLTPTAVKSLDGVNNVFASTGDVTECEYFSKGV